MKRRIQSLNGFWQYSINGVQQPAVRVPFSTICVGDSQCDLTFDALKMPHAQLCFEGITYKASVMLNGEMLGEMGPYSRYEYDVTALLKPTGNRLSVRLSDINMPFGPSEGWENYGGIIRDVYITYMDAVHIEDVIWRTSTQEPYRSAVCSVEVAVGGSASCPVSAVLLNATDDQVASASGTAQGGVAKLQFTVENPALWSPETPHLYHLVVRAAQDEVSQRVGIKDFRICGQRFCLNGKAVFLKGVNRHDMWGDEGYTLSKVQMEKDMRMIKATGCNYVRLVHYPHHPYILDLADEIGLMVSEEPGLWWSDLHNPEVVEGALEVMRRVVLRDRNHCSVVFWLAFNECVFTPEFLEASSGLCRSLDPDRPVSGANAMAKEMTRDLYKKHGFDFYTRHPYTHNIAQFKEEAAYLNDMPLVFTEWGGWYVYENGNLFEDSLNDMIDAWNAPDGGAVLAGCAYWAWADMYEFGRGRPACNEGILNEGLVDIYRNGRSNLDRFTRIMQGFGLPQVAPSAMEIAPALPRKTGARTFNIHSAADSDVQQALWQQMLEASLPQKGFTHKKMRRLTNGPALPESIIEAAGLPVYPGTRKPLVIAPDKPIRIPMSGAASQLHFIGNTALPWGYPLYGEHGEVGAKYTVRYADGGVMEIPLRNGIELTVALAQQGPSRINPIAPGAAQVIRWSYDENWEHYIANLFTVQVDSGRALESVEVASCHPECTLLLYAITAE